MNFLMRNAGFMKKLKFPKRVSLTMETPLEYTQNPSFSLNFMCNMSIEQEYYSDHVGIGRNLRNTLGLEILTQ